jgi:hypothetical protein
MAYMAAHRPELSATPNAQHYGNSHAGQQCLQIQASWALSHINPSAQKGQKKTSSYFFNGFF